MNDFRVQSVEFVITENWRNCEEVEHFVADCPFSVRSPKDGELLGLEWGMIRQVSNIIFGFA